MSRPNSESHTSPYHDRSADLGRDEGLALYKPMSKSKELADTQPVAVLAEQAVAITLAVRRQTGLIDHKKATRALLEALHEETFSGGV